jgi:BirA family biotin operon repressor/biotin-[acetyl-CoA-carboxylase] ligase
MNLAASACGAAYPCSTFQIMKQKKATVHTPPLYHHYTTVTSTNTIALEQAATGAAHGTMIHADSQTGGRGRGGRQFLSPQGGLYFSLILRPELDISSLPLTTLAAGVAICTAIRQLTRTKVQLKWPNDLYFAGRKLAGILTETGPVRRSGQAEYVAIGVGINVLPAGETFPAELRKNVISLTEMSSTRPDIDSLIHSLATAIPSSVRQLEQNKAAVLANWRRFDCLLNKQLNYHTPAGIIQATGTGLADDGQYGIVDQHGIRHQVLAGDLTPISLAE